MIHLAGFTCCLGGVALYLLSRSTGRVQKSITKVYHLKDLEQLVEEESKVLPLIIAVSGSVGSETPIKCDHSDVLGVFVKKTAEQQVLRRNWMLSWVRDSTFMQPITKEVPWYLSDGTGRVNVAVSQSEIGLALTVGSDVFEKAEPVSYVQGTLDYLKGLKILGVRRIERVVPIGTPLTVVGEAVYDGMGNVRIQKSEQGPFHVSYLPLDQLISKLGEWSRRFKYASMGLAVLGVILLSKPVIEYILKRIENILERRRQKLLLRRVVDAATRRAEPATTGLERQHGNSSGGTSRVGDAARAEPVTRGLERQHENNSGGSNRVVDAAAWRAEPVTRGLERQHENNSGGSSRVVDAAAWRAEPVTRRLERQHENNSGGSSRVVDAAAWRAEPVSRGLERQHENNSGGPSRVVDAAAWRARPVRLERQYESSSVGPSRVVDAAAWRAGPVSRGLERQHENNSSGTSRVVDAAAWRAEPVTRGLERQHENNSGGTSRDGDDTDLCVICFDQKYNTAFVQCGHMCCCLTCSLQLTTCPLCREQIEQVLRIYRH